jgi:DNA-binding SARP family transcriptional activator/DNA-binding XRE family transcriptional regulator
MFAIRPGTLMSARAFMLMPAAVAAPRELSRPIRALTTSVKGRVPGTTKVPELIVLAPGDTQRRVTPHRAETELGGLVREFRVSAGLTQQELAAVAGMSIGALRDLEQGRTRCPRWAAVDAIAVALRLDRTERAELASAWPSGHMDKDPWFATGDTGIGPGGANVHIGILGPLTARLNGAAVRLGSARQRVVLGLLALHWPAGVPRDVVVDVLWDECLPRSAVAQVQAYVSQLRRLLDPGRTVRGSGGSVRGSGGSVRGSGGSVRLAGRGYQLSDTACLDLTEFRALTRRADVAAARGDSRLACALYDRSLGLWRGEVLADVDLLRAHPAVAEVTRQYGQVVLRFARAAASIGRYERALPHLRRLCDHEPFNEQAHAELMLALAIAGQQATALQLFAQLRQRLDAELGIRPGPQVAATHLRILRQQVGYG